MELYLIRHGIAADREAYASDENRLLTDKGHQKTAKVAKGLHHQGLRFDLILTSPLVRAKQTATILQDAGLCSHIEEFPALAPDGNISVWVQWLEEWQHQNADSQSIALVGHQPDLGNWAEILVWGKSQEKLVLKKAGMIGLTLPKQGTLIGQSLMFLLVSPKWLL